MTFKNSEDSKGLLRLSVTISDSGRTHGKTISQVDDLTDGTASLLLNTTGDALLEY